MIAIPAFFLGALGRRIAGGLLSQHVGNIGGTQVARLIYAMILGGIVAVAAPVAWWGAVAVPLVWIGATAGFPTGMVPRSVLDVAGLAGHGLMAVALLAAAAWWVGAEWWWLVAAGMARAPIYYAATLWQPHVPALGLNPDGLPDPPAWAEVWAGGVLGVALAVIW